MPGHTINKLRGADHAAELQFGAGNRNRELGFDQRQFRFRGGEFRGVNKEVSPEAGFPIPIFHIFKAGANEPGPRLTNRQRFHASMLVGRAGNDVNITVRAPGNALWS